MKIINVKDFVVHQVQSINTRFFNRFFKFYHEFEHLIVSPKRRVGFEMMNIALGGHSNLVTRLHISVGLTFSGFSRTFTQRVTLVSIPKTLLVGAGDITTIVDKAKNLWKQRMQVRKCG